MRTLNCRLAILMSPILLIGLMVSMWLIHNASVPRAVAHVTCGWECNQSSPETHDAKIDVEACVKSDLSKISAKAKSYAKLKPGSPARPRTAYANISGNVSAKGSGLKPATASYSEGKQLNCKKFLKWWCGKIKDGRKVSSSGPMGSGSGRSAGALASANCDGVSDTVDKSHP